MNYELNDGSLASEYRKGDELVATRSQGKVRFGDRLVFSENTLTNNKSTTFLHPTTGSQMMCWNWQDLNPTPETRRAAKIRAGQWLIHENDFVVHADLTKEQFQKWIYWAGKYVFVADWSSYYEDYKYSIVKVSSIQGSNGKKVTSYPNYRNITKQFKEFLESQPEPQKSWKERGIQPPQDELIRYYSEEMLQYRYGHVACKWDDKFIVVDKEDNSCELKSLDEIHPNSNVLTTKQIAEKFGIDHPDDVIIEDYK